MFIRSVGILLIGLLSVTSSAQDRVTVRSKETSKPVILLGQVLDYTGAVLTIRLPSGIPQIVDSSSVIGLETFYEPDHRDALQALTDSNNTASRDKFEAAFKKEYRTWVKREILAGLVRTHQRLGDPLTAAVTFLKITETDPVTRHWGISPLIWSPVAVNAQMTQQARVWLAGEQDDACLIGASWLLLDPVYSEAAQAGLKRLLKSTNERLTAYARVQLWRLALAQNQVSDLTLQNWRGDIDRLPEALRGGPQFLRASGFWQAGDRSSAIPEFLKLPLVYVDSELLAAKSLLMAGEGLEQTGLQREAQTVYQELLFRYAWSPESAEAERRLQALFTADSPLPSP